MIYKIIDRVIISIVLIPILILSSCLGFIMIESLLYSTFYGIRARDNELVTYPNSVIQQTAEYLYANPQPTPDWIWSMRRDHIMSGEIGTICVAIDAGYYHSLFEGRNWIINGKRVPDDAYDDVYLCTLGDGECPYNVCLNINLDKELQAGIHLIELYIQRYFFDVGVSYQWVIQVGEATPTPPQS